MNDMNEPHEESVPGSRQDTHHQVADGSAAKKVRRRRIRDGLGKFDAHIPETTRRWRDRFKR